MAIAMYRLEERPEKQVPEYALKQAMELNSQNQYLKVLLALKLHKMGEKSKGEQLMRDALEKAPNQMNILQKAAQFYRIRGNLDRAIELLGTALLSTTHNSPLYCLIMCCYREKLKKLKNTGEADNSKRSAMMEELRKLTVEYMHKALQRRQSPLNSYSDLIDFREVKRCYCMVFNKESPCAEEQELYERYCNLQECHRKSEDLAALMDFMQFPRYESPLEKEEVKQQT
ncbi:Interferon-induced protein with tetratricopeptide repeats 3B [Apodemus speciosus]|uniref:Interferon-induced protein with tetratricopeptide repeats 3B n=1 Tax=Apodemus speciosus TaxID=105296 RepID=A0ABQ0FSX7_APOSI